MFVIKPNDFLQDLTDYSEKIVKKYKQNNPPIEFIPQYYLNVKQNHFSPSQINMPNDVWLHNYIFRDQEWRRTAKIPNPNMVAGNAAQDGINQYVFNNKNVREAQAYAIRQYKKNKVLYTGDVLERFNKNMEVMAACVANGIAALDTINITEEKNLTTEVYCEYFFPGIEVVTIGRTDLMASSKYLVELKTKWHTKKLQKGNIPKEEPDFNYLCQVAFYWKATGLEPILIYHTGMPVKDKKTKEIKNEYKIFSKENCKQLTPAAMEEYLEHCRVVLTVRQNLLKISSDPKVLAQHVQPDFNSFYWDDLNEEQLKEAKALWGM